MQTIKPLTKGLGLYLLGNKQKPIEPFKIYTKPKPLCFKR